ncbi:DUF4148 domain-containing protein [Paraburkholderia tropica]|uniref:DUF4148 domain-containing protein n=1 Tax=Paraburkholderia tropica TaxID=92647 RepID=UPI002AB24559|nr:DUF4148 domain-containing protein [Paraburkholderia tropica]
MNAIQRTAVVAALFATPIVALAQTAPSSDSLTRAQVQQDQLQMRQAGYDQSVGDQASYPRQVQAAEARIGAQQVSAASTGGYGGVAGGYGGVAAGSSAWGPNRLPEQSSGATVQPAHTGTTGLKPVYFGQ